MTSEHSPSDVPSGWTLSAYIAHSEALRSAEEKLQAERDRRYAEVKSAEEKALRVKEQADRDALGLAREIQTYKDEKANELREQINSERGLYATKDDLTSAIKEMSATIRPVVDFMTATQGGHAQRRADVGQFNWSVNLVVGIVLFGLGLVIAHFWK